MKCLYVGQTHDDAMVMKEKIEDTVGRFGEDEDWFFVGIGGALTGRRFDYIEIGPMYFKEPRLMEETMQYLEMLSTKMKPYV